MEKLPKVSVFVATYNRVATNKYLLEECVQSFLNQDYPNKELVIVNDHPKQTIVYEHPNVHIFNLGIRFKTLGEKLNAAVGFCTGDILMPHDDDDVTLKCHISDAVARLGDFSYWNPRGYFYWPATNKVQHPGSIGYCHNCSAFTKEAFKKVGGYPSVSGPQDAHMDGLLRKLNDTSPLVHSGPSEWTFIYRFGQHGIHLSAFGDTEKAYREYEAKATSSGTFILNPHWRYPYEELCAEFARRWERDQNLAALPK